MSIYDLTRIRSFIANHVKLAGFCPVLLDGLMDAYARRHPDASPNEALEARCRLAGVYAYENLCGGAPAAKADSLLEQAGKRMELDYVISRLFWYLIEQLGYDPYALFVKGLHEDLSLACQALRERGEEETADEAIVLLERIESCQPALTCSVYAAVPVYALEEKEFYLYLCVRHRAARMQWDEGEGGDALKETPLEFKWLGETRVEFGQAGTRKGRRSEAKLGISLEPAERRATSCARASFELREPLGRPQWVPFKVKATAAGLKELRCTVYQGGKRIGLYTCYVHVVPFPYVGREPGVRIARVPYGRRPRFLGFIGEILFATASSISGTYDPMVYQINLSLWRLVGLQEREIRSAFGKIRARLSPRTQGAGDRDVRLIIGIDFGAAYSVVVIPREIEGECFQTVRGVSVVKYNRKRETTPSVVAVDRGGHRRVGQRAKDLVGARPAPIMFFKRWVGEKVPLPLGDLQLQPEEATAAILRHLKRLAEDQYRCRVDGAVITVPAHFRDTQRQKIEEAGRIAELGTIEILDEPVAAALTYCSDDRDLVQAVMICDFGGGTCEIAILKRVEGGCFDVIACEWDDRLGGCELDQQLASWILDRLKEQHQLDVRRESPEWNKLLVLAEEAKIELSHRESYVLSESNVEIVDADGKPLRVDVEITREVLEQLVERHIDGAIGLCRQAMKDADPPIELQAIDEILLIGGGSRIPLVARRLRDEFGDRVRQVDEPELWVAIGAGIRARQLS